MSSHKWVDEPYTFALIATAQSYRNADGVPDGRVFAFNNGAGVRWAAITYDEHHVTQGKNFDTVEEAKRHVEQVVQGTEVLAKL